MQAEDCLSGGAAQSMNLLNMVGKSFLHSLKEMMLAWVHMSWDVFLTVGEVRGQTEAWVAGPWVLIKEWWWCGGRGGVGSWMLNKERPVTQCFGHEIGPNDRTPGFEGAGSGGPRLRGLRVKEAGGFISIKGGSWEPGVVCVGAWRVLGAWILGCEARRGLWVWDLGLVACFLCLRQKGSRGSLTYFYGGAAPARDGTARPRPFAAGGHADCLHSGRESGRAAQLHQHDVVNFPGPVKPGVDEGLCGPDLLGISIDQKITAHLHDVLT